MGEININGKRVIGERCLSEVFTRINEDYAVHGNRISHIGGYMSIGYSIVNMEESEHKINVKSLMESDLVGVSEYIEYNSWLMAFLEDKNLV